MENNELIHAKMIAVLRDVGAITKDRTNQQQGFKFRGIDQFMNECHMHFAKHGIFMTTHVEDCIREERITKSGGNLIYTNLRVRFCFHAEDGSMVCSTMQGEGMDSADKSTNKAMAVALKYCLMQAFSVPTEEMQDPDAVTPPPSVKHPAGRVMPQEGGNWHAGNKAMQGNPGKPSEKQIKMLTTIITERVWRGTDDEREIETILTAMTAGTAKAGDISRAIDLVTRYPKAVTSDVPKLADIVTLKEINEEYKRIDLNKIPKEKRDKASIFDIEGWSASDAAAWLKYLKSQPTKGGAQ